jgi:hypothetical protein
MYLQTQFYASALLASTSNQGPPHAGWSSPIGDVQQFSPLSWCSYDLRASGMVNFQAIAVGTVYSPVATTIQFRTRSDDGVVIILNNALVHSVWTANGDQSLTSTAVALPAGFTPITVRHFDSGANAFFDLSWSIGGAAFTADGYGVMYGPFNASCPAGSYCVGKTRFREGDGECAAGRYCPASSTSAQGQGPCQAGMRCFFHTVSIGKGIPFD